MQIIWVTVKRIYSLHVANKPKNKQIGKEASVLASAVTLTLRMLKQEEYTEIRLSLGY